MKRRIILTGFAVIFIMFTLVLGSCENPTGNKSGGKLDAPYIGGNFTLDYSRIIWGAVPGAIGYEVQGAPKYINDSYGSWTTLIKTSYTEYTHYTTSVYRYRVRAYNGSKNSDWSNIAETY